MTLEVLAICSRSTSLEDLFDRNRGGFLSIRNSSFLAIAESFWALASPVMYKLSLHNQRVFLRLNRPGTVARRGAPAPERSEKKRFFSNGTKLGIR